MEKLLFISSPFLDQIQEAYFRPSYKQEVVLHEAVSSWASVKALNE